jgi:hypothetical protein
MGQHSTERLIILRYLWMDLLVEVFIQGHIYLIIAVFTSSRDCEKVIGAIRVISGRSEEPLHVPLCVVGVCVSEVVPGRVHERVHGVRLSAGWSLTS